MKKLSLVLLLTLVGLSDAAPAPGRKEPLKEPTKGSVRSAELHQVSKVHWNGSWWEIGLQDNGAYWCHRGLEDGRGTIWFGTWRLEIGDKPGEVVVVLEESVAFVSPDNPPTPGDSSPARLTLKRVDGKIAGTSNGGTWGMDADVVLE